MRAPLGNLTRSFSANAGGVRNNRYNRRDSNAEDLVVHSTLVLWLIAGLSLATGGVIGFFTPRFLKGNNDSNHALEEELQNLRDRHDNYRHDVANHFNKTAELLSQLLGNYREVHNHLAAGADALCANASIKRLQPLSDDRLIEQQLTTTLEVPRDYAPRPAAGGKGILDEDFGIEKIQREHPPEPPRY